MDPLSDLLRVVRLDGAYFYAVQAAGPWTVETVAARELSPRIMPDAEHLISYHIVTGGRCYGGVIGDELVELAAGDVIVFPHGDAHVMSSGRDVRIGEDVQRTPQPQFPFTVFLGDQAQPGASLVCGFLGCDRRPFNPLLAALPHRMHMRGISSGWLGSFTRQVTEESRLGRAGAASVLTRLAELRDRAYADSASAGVRPPSSGESLRRRRDPARNGGTGAGAEHELDDGRGVEDDHRRSRSRRTSAAGRGRGCTAVRRARRSSNSARVGRSAARCSSASK